MTGERLESGASVLRMTEEEAERTFIRRSAFTADARPYMSADRICAARSVTVTTWRPLPNPLRQWREDRRRMDNRAAGPGCQWGWRWQIGLQWIGVGIGSGHNTREGAVDH